jgi:hypothetical protein
MLRAKPTSNLTVTVDVGARVGGSSNSQWDCERKVLQNVGSPCIDAAS